MEGLGKVGWGGGGPAAVRVRCTGGTAGQVTGTVTLGALRAAPHRVHLAGPQHRVTALMDSSDLGLEGLVAQAPGTRRPATASVSQVLGAIS